MMRDEFLISQVKFTITTEPWASVKEWRARQFTPSIPESPMKVEPSFDSFFADVWPKFGAKIGHEEREIMREAFNKEIYHALRKNQ